MPTQLTPSKFLGLAVIVYAVGVILNGLAYTLFDWPAQRNETIASIATIVAVLLVIGALAVWVLRSREE